MAKIILKYSSNNTHTIMSARIALFLHQPRCSIQCGNAMMTALESHYKFKIFTKHEVEDDFFDDVDMVAFPGGDGDAASFSYLLRSNGEAVKRYLDNGGRYLGICMGAYWAGSEYFDILDSVDAPQYIVQPGTDTRRPHTKAIHVTWQNQPERMFFYDGCAMIGDETKFETIARYANGNPMAIVQNRIGLIGCHPESMPNWYTNHNYMRPHWHEYRHHKLLLDFVDRLMAT